MHIGSTGSQCSQLKRIQSNLIVIIRFIQMNGMCNVDLIFYTACVHRDINMSLNKTGSCT